MFEKTQQMTAQRLVEKGVPAKRAEEKAEGTAVGKLLVALGVVFMLLAGAVAILLLVLTRGTLDVKGLIALGIFAVPGAAFVILGVSLISREAAPLIDALGMTAVKIVRKARGKNGS